MKKGIILTIIILGFLSPISAQVDSLAQFQNSIFPNFEPYSTPRTNGRPGSVFRTDYTGVTFFAEDVAQIPENKSDEGDIVGRMFFSAQQLLQMLNIEFSSEEPIPVEVTLKQVVREYNEQTTLDNVLWGSGKIEKLVVDENSSYYIIRETVSTKEVSFRFSKEDYDKIITGADQLIKRKGKKGAEPDFPYEISKKWKEPHRVFFLKQDIGLEQYPEPEIEEE